MKIKEIDRIKRPQEGYPLGKVEKVALRTIAMLGLGSDGD
jgi:hypothetical protein